MAVKIIHRLTNSPALMAILFCVLVFSLYVLGNTADNLDQFGEYYPLLLLADGIVLAFIAILIGANTVHLIREFRQQVAGSRLTVKLIIMSVFLALVPVTLVYTFSVKFIRSNIDSWFDVEIEQVLDNALELSRNSLLLQQRIMLKVTEDLAEELVGVSADAAINELNELGSKADALELTLIGANNRIIASTGFTGKISVTLNRPPEGLISRARAGEAYVEIDPVGDDELTIRAIVPVLSDDPLHRNNVLQALYPVGKRSSELAFGVETSYQNYRKLVFLRRPLKIGSILTLSLALLLSVLTALWFAFYAARRMMAPIHNLVEGTRLVAQGDYSIRIYKDGRDELSFLVDSFNDMTGRLSQSRRLTRVSQDQLESQRAYLETVLRHISTGVVTLDADGMLRTSNNAAAAILGDDINQMLGFSLFDKDGASVVIQQFATQLKPLLDGHDDWSQELEIFNQKGRRVLLCRGTPLLTSESLVSGTVIVFDDITAMMQAQRNDAWSEVARRLAHEIKNPLTPIQLSAERLRRKCMHKLPADDAELMDRLTHTIVQQVDSMKSMVKAFAEYANAPTVQFVRTDINGLILEVVDLYKDMDDSVEMSVQLGTNIPMIPIDVARVRQLLHNLIKNAMESQKGIDKSEVVITTLLESDNNSRSLQLRVDDGGPGFPVELLARLFEPYVTSKPKGTGLGLAIVKKIVEEHNGVVYAINRDEGGGSIRVRLPISDSITFGG